MVKSTSFRKKELNHRTIVVLDQDRLLIWGERTQAEKEGCFGLLGSLQHSQTKVDHASQQQGVNHNRGVIFLTLFHHQFNELRKYGRPRV